jgi:hypothetical protein
MNKKILIISLVFFLGLSFVAYQYIKELQLEFTNAAYSTSKPANGHSWSEMECTSGICIVEGNTGMGTFNPGYKLDVQGGQINASGGLCIAGDCKVNWAAVSSPSVWTTSSTTIYNSNTGNVGIGTASPSQKLEVNGSILASGTGDICNGAGKCLNSVFQTNSIAGTNPTCPTGQTAIMKANAGIWYTATATQVASSWSQVTCGSVMTTDGTPLLMVGNHTQQQCVTAGGTVVSAGGTDTQCRFEGSSCPSNWTHNTWCTMGANTCCAGKCDSTCGNSGCCTSASKAWGESCTSTCTYISWGWSGMSGCYSCGNYTCTSPILQVGCY